MNGFLKFPDMALRDDCSVKLQIAKFSGNFTNSQLQPVIIVENADAKLLDLIKLIAPAATWMPDVQMDKMVN